MSEATDISNETSLTWWQRHGQRTRWVIQIALAGVILAVVVWRTTLASVPVVSHTVATQTVIAEVMGTGTLEARTSSVVGPKIGGLIAYVAADQGDRVEANALLFRDVAHEHGTAVIVVTHDHRALDVFDTIYEMEDGALSRSPTGSPSAAAPSAAEKADRPGDRRSE